MLRAVPNLAVDRKLNRDLRIVARFVQIYCRDKHGAADREAFHLKTHDAERVSGGPLLLCADCRKLLAHSWTMRARCPLDPKPACKKCPVHCYATGYRERMRAVMRHSGMRLVLSGRVDYLLKLWF